MGQPLPLSRRDAMTQHSSLMHACSSPVTACSFVTFSAVSPMLRSGVIWSGYCDVSRPEANFAVAALSLDLGASSLLCRRPPIHCGPRDLEKVQPSLQSQEPIQLISPASYSRVPAFPQSRANRFPIATVCCTTRHPYPGQDSRNRQFSALSCHL